MTNESSMTSLVKKSGGFLVFMGIAVLILGIISIKQPLMTGVAVTIMLGCILLISGIVQFFHGFKVIGSGARIWSILVGLFTIVAACLILARPVFALGTLTLVVAVFLFADGLLTSIAAFQSRSERGWGWTLFNGLVTLLLGWLIWREWPISGAWAIGLLIGIRIFMTGMGMLLMGSAARGVAGAADDY